MSSQLGKIHIYTGNGKGKTTAALGLALRAVGAGLKVYIIQFLKGQNYSELQALKQIKNITLKRFGEESFIHGEGKVQDRLMANEALAWAKKVIAGNKYNLVILDEIFLAIFFKLIKEEELAKIIVNKPANVELILTGRKAPLAIIKLADYVTEMKEIKHPYQKGLLARQGIEN